MFLSLINNYNIRPVEAQYLWVFYKQLQEFNKEDVTYILDESYLKEYSQLERWELQEVSTEKHFYKPPVYPIYCNYLDLKFGHSNRISSQALLEFSAVQEYELSKNIENTHEFIKKFGKDLNGIKAGLTFVNNNRFKFTLNAFKIPVIHNELGALRGPVWKDTFYFDFNGVNGNTEFDRRFEKFKKIVHKIDILKREELIRIAAKRNHIAGLFSALFQPENKFKVGIPLQVENDTNIICYNNGWNQIDLITYAIKQYKWKNVLLRNHPNATIQASKKFYNIDTSPYCYDFIDKVEKIITINSSVGFEAMLLGKEVEILGDNPFKNSCDMSEYEKLLALNFAVISYLVPTKMLYNKDYYNFRLECKDELELWKKGYELWTK